ncbi:hypothetical protein LC613_42225 [Nostoc sphaeroides CHAB 2801]|nr:hypothetical protein [Nostoc sphaeroides]MCC5634028.1 hypothetical protein [Nostoc sphaeroides CHAB 2801]
MIPSQPDLKSLPSLQMRSLKTNQMINPSAIGLKSLPWLPLDEWSE